MGFARKALLVLMALGLTAGAAYSYDQVRFGERTVAFFRSMFAGEDAFRNARGRRGSDRRSSEPVADSARSVGEARDGRRRPSRGEGETGEMRERPSRDGGEVRRGGGGRGRRNDVSLEEGLAMRAKRVRWRT